MYEETFAAYVDATSFLKAVAQPEYTIGIKDFSVTLLFSFKQPGMLLCSLRKSDTDELWAGWYLALREDGTLIFYTSDGHTVNTVVADVESVCLREYWHHLVAVRRGESLELYLDGKRLTAVAQGVSTRLDLGEAADLLMGECPYEDIEEGIYRGFLKCVTFWLWALPDDQFDFTASDVPYGDLTGLRGWWSLSNTLADRSDWKHPIIYCENVSFLPVFGLSLATGCNGYQYSNVSQSIVPHLGQGAATNQLSPASAGDLIQRRRMTVRVDGRGVLLGTCCTCSPAVEFPMGVTLTVLTPSGINISTLQSNDKQLIVLRGRWVFQFLFLEPELGDWTLELTAGSDSSFELEYQFVPAGSSRQELLPPLERLYPQYGSNERADGIHPGFFLLSSLGKMVTYDLNTRLERRASADSKGGKNTPNGMGALLVAALTITAIYIVVEWIEGLIEEPEPSKPEYAGKPYPGQYQFDSTTLTLQMLNFYEWGESAPWDVYKSIQKKFCYYSVNNPKGFYTRKDLDKVQQNYKFHLDIGGEGCFGHKLGGSMASGFANAVNVNAQVSNSQDEDLFIPFLVWLEGWNSQWPFESGMVDRITAQGVPSFTTKEREEVVRCIRKEKGSRVDFWIADNRVETYDLPGLASQIRKKISSGGPSVRVIMKAEDPEFPEYVKGFGKYSIVLE